MLGQFCPKNDIKNQTHLIYRDKWDHKCMIPICEIGFKEKYAYDKEKPSRWFYYNDYDFLWWLE